MIVTDVPAIREASGSQVSDRFADRIRGPVLDIDAGFEAIGLATMGPRGIGQLPQFVETGTTFPDDQACPPRGPGKNERDELQHHKR